MQRALCSGHQPVRCGHLLTLLVPSHWCPFPSIPHPPAHNGGIVGHSPNHKVPYFFGFSPNPKYDSENPLLGLQHPTSHFRLLAMGTHVLKEKPKEAAALEPPKDANLTPQSSSLTGRLTAFDSSVQWGVTSLPASSRKSRLSTLSGFWVPQFPPCYLEIMLPLISQNCPEALATWPGPEACGNFRNDSNDPRVKTSQISAEHAGLGPLFPPSFLPHLSTEQPGLLDTR